MSIVASPFQDLIQLQSQGHMGYASRYSSCDGRHYGPEPMRSLPTRRPRNAGYGWYWRRRP
ncbi:hypothetical protein C8Q70DRAFT_978030 [Cubamyces menziesii]|nr:hypothetical protein C8Q70DRAFT_978030 [Cubamyces menziesii]